MIHRVRLLLLLSWLSVSAIAQEPAIVPGRATYLPNEPILVQFFDGPGNLKDWIGLYKENAAAGNFLFWQYLDGSQTGKAPLTDGSTTFLKGLAEPGTYDIRLFENDAYGLLATATITVENSPRLFVAQSLVAPGQPISINVTNAPGNPKDWVGLFAAGAANGNFVARRSLDAIGPTLAGALQFDPVTNPGLYEARLFAADSSEPLDQVAFEVGFPAPRLHVTSDGAANRLSWETEPWNVPVQRYIVQARSKGAATPVVIAELNATQGTNSFLHAGLTKGSEWCYSIKAVGTESAMASVSSEVCIETLAADPGFVTAFAVESPTEGNAAWPGALGLDFEVVNAISISHLGVFDDLSDGLKRPLVARLYDRTLRKDVAKLEFSPSSPGSLIGGYRYKPLTSPLAFSTGFKGTIIAEGYGIEERFGNKGIANIDIQVQDGEGAVLFLGRGRYGKAGGFPATVDGGPATRYAAGTFQFKVTSVTAPGRPVLKTIPDNRSVSLSWTAMTQPVPAAKYQVLRSSGSSGTFTQIAETTATEYRDSSLTNGEEVCYKVRAIAATGVAGPDSDTECQTPDEVAAGIAYIHPPELPGNQAYGGSVGNDFDVLRPIRVTKLGVFDDSSDGLQRSLSVRLYDRSNGLVLAQLTFGPGDEGELVGGSRFKVLATPVVLQPGLEAAIVASGYGAGERVGNKGVPSSEEMILELFGGGCLRFVGLSRFGDDPNGFPEIRDGGPADRYAAGTFYFEPFTPALSPLTIQRASNGTTIQLTWTGSAQLESAPGVDGPWKTIAGQSGIAIEPEATAQFYRLRPSP